MPFEYRTLEDPSAMTELKARWPFAHFPILVDDGDTIVKSTIIIEHLMLTRGGRVRWLPDDPLEALEVRFLDRFFDNDVMTAMQKPVFAALKQDKPRTDEALTEARRALELAYGWLEQRLQGRTWAAGETLSLDALMARVGESGVRTVCVTGGEPLAQKNCLPFLAALADAGYSVSLETSGALDIAGVDPRVARIVDVKAPGSDEVEKNRWDNLSHLTPHDEVKFVLADRADYDWAVAMLAEHRLAERCPVLFSPVAAELDPTALADWIVADRLPVRMQVQLHKVLWGNTAGK